MGVEDITYSSDFLKDVEIKVSYLINIPEKGILEKKEVEFLKWFFFNDKLCKRWRWYFKYRAALLQVKYPKYDVELKFSTSDLQSKEQELNLLERRIIAKKRKVTEVQNKINLFKKNYSELFSIDENHIFLKLKQIENKKIEELSLLESQYKQISI